jgi:hypothetical protein
VKSLVLGGGAILVLLALHLLPGCGGVDPVRETLSEYPLRSVAIGVPYVFALLSANVATILVGVTMARRGLLRGVVATALLAAWSVGLLGLTVFLKDPLGSHGTWYGEVHKYCATANFASLPVLGLLLWWRFRSVPRWRRHARTAGVLAAAGLAFAAPFASAFLLHGTVEALGLVERAVVVIHIALIATMAAWSRAMPDMPAQTVPRVRHARGVRRIDTANSVIA